MKRLLACALLLLCLTACDDNDTELKPPVNPDPVIPVTVNYSSIDATISESIGTHTVTIEFSAPAPANGNIEITFESEQAVYGEHFHTEPALQDEKISLIINKGQTEVSFVVQPVNDPELKGHKAVAFSIVKAEGGVAVGDALVYDLVIKDAQLVNKLHTETRPDFPYLKRTFTYNEAGQIAKIDWEAQGAFGPGITTGTNVYHYNEAGLLTRIVRGTLVFNYSYENGRLVRYEAVNNDIIASYTLYAYDEADKLSREDMFVHQGEGKYAYSFRDYEYDVQGVLYQVKSYSTFEETPKVYNTTTYLEYAEGFDPAPLVEIPGVPKELFKIPLRYTVKTYEDTPQEFNIAYDLRDDGYVTERRVTGPNGTQKMVFTYY